MRRVILKKI